MHGRKASISETDKSSTLAKTDGGKGSAVSTSPKIKERDRYINYMSAPDCRRCFLLDDELAIHESLEIYAYFVLIHSV